MSSEGLFTGLNHVSLLVTDIERAANFYINLLGMEMDTTRPDMAFPGMWMKCGNQQIHLLSLARKSSGTADIHPGRDAHFAISVNDIIKIEDLLRHENITSHMSKSGRKALFCRDPDGNGIEFVETGNK